ncbi:MAG: hypothetical protein WC958_03430 [Dehalococcoidales bacterium]
MFELTPPLIIIAGIICVLLGVVAMVWPKKGVYVLASWLIIVGVLAIIYSLE